jgi:MFS family permease
VLSLISSTAGLISPLSLLVAGPIADTLGIQAWYWIAAAACIIMAAGGMFIPAIIHIEEQGKELIESQIAAAESTGD